MSDLILDFPVLSLDSATFNDGVGYEVKTVYDNKKMHYYAYLNG